MMALQCHHIFVGHMSQLRSPVLQAEGPMGQLGLRDNTVASGKQKKVNFWCIKVLNKFLNEYIFFQVLCQRWKNKVND